MASSRSSRKSKKRISRRFNLRGLALLGGLIVVAIALYFPWKSYSNQRVRGSALAQARESLEKKDLDLAIRHLDRYLADNPHDVVVLEAKAKMLADAAISPDQCLQAASALDQLLRLDPNGAGRFETRRKMAELYITFSDGLRRYAEHQPDGTIRAKESRYPAAVTLAEQLVKERPDDGGAHRLLGMAIQGQLPELREAADQQVNLTKAIDLTGKELRRAIELNPHDILASEKLAEYYFTTTNSEKSGNLVLEEMLKSDPKSVEVRLARYRILTRMNRNAEAIVELEAALLATPDNVMLRTEAARLALQRTDPATARKHLDAIPEKFQNDLRVRSMRGAMEFSEQHPDQGVDEWRQGLSLVDGGDRDLNFRLATTLISMGRLAEARPIMDQYHRLVKARDPMGIYLEGLFQERSGHVTEAIEKFNRAHTLVSSSLKTEVLISLARCYQLMGEEDRALASYKNASSSDPTSVTARRALAKAYGATDPWRAISELKHGLEIVKDDSNMLTDLIRLEIAEYRRPSAEKKSLVEIQSLFDRLRKSTPNSPSLLGMEAQILSASGRFDEAEKKLGEMARGPGRPRIEAWLAWADLLERLTRPQDALKVIDEGSSSAAAGDHALSRIAKSQILLRQGNGTAAREVLESNLDSVPKAERPDLYRGLGELLHSLGQRDASRAAFEEWAKLAPESPLPALTLLNMASLDNDDQAAKLGLTLLEKLGRENQPYARIAQAMELLRTDPARPGPPPADRLDRADMEVAALTRIAPDHPMKPLLQGMIQEYRTDASTEKTYREGLTKASELYGKGFKFGSVSLVLPRMIEINFKLRAADIDRLTKQKNAETDPAKQAAYLQKIAMTKRVSDDNLLALRRQYEALSSFHRANADIEFARISAAVALKLGDRTRAEDLLTKVADSRPDDTKVRVAHARLLDANGKTTEADDVYQDLVRLHPEDSVAWLSLISYRVLKRTPEEVARTIEQARIRYTGERPELFLAQCFWFGKDKASAERFYQVAVDKRPEDLVTLRSLVEFKEATDQGDQVEAILRKALKIDNKAGWAARNLAYRISARQDPATWPEAWALIAPGAPGMTNTPEDRLTQATILARSPDSSRRSEAIAAFASLATDLPLTNPIGIDARIRLSQAMLEINRTSDAWIYISPLADDVSRPNAIALAIGIEALARAGKPDEAEHRLDRLVVLVPKVTQIALSRGWVLFARGKKAEASASVRSAYDNAEKAPEAKFISSTCLDLLMKFNDLDAALDLARKIATRWPQDAATLARVQVARKEFDQALDSCRIAMEAGSAREALRFAVATAIGRRTDQAFVKKVGEFGDLARSKAPTDPNVLISLATIRHLQDRYEAEMECYREALLHRPTNYQFLNNMAWTLCEALNKPQEALERIEEVIKREGRSAAFLDTRGVILCRLNRVNEAIVDLEESVKGDPSSLTFFHLARAYRQANKPDESRRCRDLALSKNFDPQSLDATDRADLVEVMGKL